MERRSGKCVDEDLRRGDQVVPVVRESHAIGLVEDIQTIRHELSPTFRWRSLRNQCVSMKTT